MTKRNQFSQKMKEKSDHELMEIVKSEKYLDDARVAAALEIKERKYGPTVEVEDGKARELRLFKEFVITKNVKESKKFRAAALFVFGMLCIGVSGYIFFLVEERSTLWLPMLILISVGIACILIVKTWWSRENMD